MRCAVRCTEPPGGVFSALRTHIRAFVRPSPRWRKRRCACWRKGLQTLRESMGCRCTPVPRLWSFPNTASGTRRASTARKWSVSQGIQSGWKGSRPAPGLRLCGVRGCRRIQYLSQRLHLLLCHHTPGAAAARPRRPCTGRADAHRMAAGREQITDRTGPSLRAEQTSLFDNL